MIHLMANVTLLPLARERNSSSMGTSTDLTKFQSSIDDTSESFACNQSSRHGECVKLKGSGEVLLPPPSSNRTEENGVGY